MAEQHTPGQPTEDPDKLLSADLKGHPLTPELRQWALQQLSEDQAVALLQELREKGGLELTDFIHEIEKAATQP